MKHQKQILLVLLLALLPDLARAEALQQVLSGAASRGLPVAALENKILEGRTKKVPPARLRRVLEQLVRHMLQARSSIQQGQRPVPGALMVACAEARLAGLAPTTILSVISPGGLPQDVRRVDALVTLHLLGFSGTAAVELLRARAETSRSC